VIEVEGLEGLTGLSRAQEASDDGDGYHCEACVWRGGCTRQALRISEMLSFSQKATLQFRRRFRLLAIDKRTLISLLLPRYVWRDRTRFKFLPHHPCASTAGQPHDVCRGPRPRGSRIQAHQLELLQSKGYNPADYPAS
jgi:hypothetical protein